MDLLLRGRRGKAKRGGKGREGKRGRRGRERREGRTTLHTPCRKFLATPLGITSSNTDRLTKFFHFYNLFEICNEAVIKYPKAPKTRHYTTL